MFVPIYFLNPPSQATSDVAGSKRFKKMIKVALETSGLQGRHGVRGVGFYTKRLIEAFKVLKQEDLEIQPISLARVQIAQLQEYSVLHFPYFDPFFLTLPLRKILPMVVTVHDLIPLKFPEHFPKGAKGWLKWQIQKTSLKGVKAIITDSDSSKKDIIDIVGFPKEKIYRIYLAAGKEFQPIKDSSLKKIVQKYSLEKKFILYVGDLNWNKNIHGLVRAFAKLKPTKLNLDLTIVGKAFLEKDLVERKKLIHLIKKLDLESQIKFLGFVPTDDLVALFNLASCYCQPSYYEGFGLPVLEAMQAGCPVICSDKGSLSEIVGKATLRVDPYQVEQIIKGIKKVLDNRRLCDKLKEEGIKQAKKFSWEKTARQTLEVYRKVYEGH